MRGYPSLIVCSDNLNSHARIAKAENNQSGIARSAMPTGSADNATRARSQDRADRIARIKRVDHDNGGGLRAA